MCAFIFVSTKKFVHQPPLFASCTNIYFSHQKAYPHQRDKILFQQTSGEKTKFCLVLNRPFFLFFCHRGFLRTRRAFVFGGEKKTNDSIFFPLAHTQSYRHFSHRNTLRLQRYARKHTLNTTRKMFSLTQSASFCATKVCVAAQKKQQSKIKRSIQAKAISSESLSKRDFLSAAVLSFGFLSVGDANAATKRVRKSSSSGPGASSTKNSPATKKSAAKPAYKPKGKTVVPVPSVATSPAARRGRRGVPIAGKSSSASSGGKRKNRSPAQARKGKY